METSKTPPHLHQIIRTVRQRFPEIGVAFLFGSLARGNSRPDSDLDLGVAGIRPLSAEQRFELILALSEAVGRPIDLIDLQTAGPLILRSWLRGQRVLATDHHLLAALIIRSLDLTTDFEPYRRRILEYRRKAWIGI
ncbi:MAG: DNA polymerase, beta-like region [Candidatus Ozemobacter sibiricus]|jgi:predicted nucleotidyltransferase|uniref:DNA polymerase, beta-like region n=1 Tax=Candidatus Ozemobacter sibiricus TaxID=2268124 RepID=A0A367ZMQ9_9BACT|nr:MAG: DNA polymerase, beta-like region [Candidatus Ozemobacter sibiricus]